jgi:hypothetical protein
METEYKLITDADFAADWVKEEVSKSVEWFSKKIHSGCVCDCEKNYGKGCLNSKAYLRGDCK